MIRGGYLIEVTEKDGKKAIRKVADDHVVEEGVEHEEIGLKVFELINLMKRSRYVLGTM